jgi:hypothetical protein
VDGDGIPDFIVGKRYWSHEESYTDPDPYGPPILYWYPTVRNKNAPGGAEFVPELIHNRSGGSEWRRRAGRGRVDQPRNVHFLGKSPAAMKLPLHHMQ